MKQILSQQGLLPAGIPRCCAGNSSVVIIAGFDYHATVAYKWSTIIPCAFCSPVMQAGKAGGQRDVMVADCGS